MAVDMHLSRSWRMLLGFETRLLEVKVRESSVLEIFTCGKCNCMFIAVKSGNEVND
jgi:hypothetical protein